MLEGITPSTSSAPLPPEAPTPEKRETWRTVLTIIFLFIMPLVGLILTWVLAPWRRRVKIIVTAIFAIPLIGILLTIILVAIRALVSA